MFLSFKGDFYAQQQQASRYVDFGATSQQQQQQQQSTSSSLGSSQSSAGASVIMEGLSMDPNANGNGSTSSFLVAQLQQQQHNHHPLHQHHHHHQQQQHLQQQHHSQQQQQQHSLSSSPDVDLDASMGAYHLSPNMQQLQQQRHTIGATSAIHHMNASAGGSSNGTVVSAVVSGASSLGLHELTEPIW